MSRPRKYDYSYPGETASIQSLSDRVEEIEESGGGGGTGTTDYNKLKNLPTLGGEVVIGDKQPEDYGAVNNKDSISISRIDEICT